MNLCLPIQELLVELIQMIKTRPVLENGCGPPEAMNASIDFEQFSSPILLLYKYLFICVRDIAFFGMENLDFGWQSVVVVHLERVLTVRYHCYFVAKKRQSSPGWLRVDVKIGYCWGRNDLFDYYRPFLGLVDNIIIIKSFFYLAIAVMLNEMSRFTTIVAHCTLLRSL